MNKNEHLFQLIKSLTPAEKKYFRSFVSRGEKNYLRLFNYIDSQPFFSDEEIKHHFAEEKFIKQLHVTKNYLSKLILKSLRSYHNKISIESQLNDLLKDAEILFKKELYAQAVEIINKVINLAERYEKFPQLLAGYEWKRKILLRTSTPLAVEEQQNEILGESINIAEKIISENKYWYLTFDSLGFFTGKYHNVSEYFRNGLLREENFPDSLRAKILFLHLRHTLFLRDGKIKDALQEIDQLIRLLEENPDRVSDEPSSYVTALNNKITMLLTNKYYEEIPDLLEKVRNVPEKYHAGENNFLTTKSILRTFNIELEMYRDTKEFEKGYVKIALINEFMEKYAEMIQPDYSMLLFYQFAYFSFMQKDFKQALNWTNKIINGNYGKVREDIQSFSRFLNMMIHLELKNVYVLRYAVESTRRFLKKKRELHNFEKVLLKYFSKVSMCNPEKHNTLLANLEKDLFAKTDEKVKSIVLDYLDFEVWINTHL